MKKLGQLVIAVVIAFLGVISIPNGAANAQSSAPQASSKLWRTCAQAIAHGQGNFRKGQSWKYYKYRDTDHDKVVCEH